MDVSTVASLTECFALRHARCTTRAGVGHDHHRVRHLVSARPGLSPREAGEALAHLTEAGGAGLNLYLLPA